MQKTVAEKRQAVRMSEGNHKKELGITYSRTMKFSLLNNKQDKFPSDTDLHILLSQVIKGISLIERIFSELSNIFQIYNNRQKDNI